MESKQSTVTAKSFVLYKDFNSTLNKLTDEQSGKLIKAIFEWQINGEYSPMEFALELVITPLISQFERDNEKYESICKRNRENGKQKKKTKKPLGATGKSGNPNKPDGSYNNTNTNTNTDSDIYSKEFERFWEVYPKKRGKGGAFNSWNKSKNRPPVEKIIQKVTELSKSKEWTKDGGQFIPMPQTWINQSRWDDETEQELNSPAFDIDKILKGYV